jgi:hypothetical protein
MDEPRIRIRRLDATLAGITAGLVAGLGLLLATNWLVLKGGDEVGPHLSLLAQFLPGYRVTFLGSLIGFVWASLWGFVAGWFVSRLYNRLAGPRIDGT